MLRLRTSAHDSGQFRRFDSSKERLYPRLVLLSGGLADLSGNSRQRRNNARNRGEAGSPSADSPETSNDSAVEYPAALRETQSWLNHLNVPRRFQSPIIRIVGVIALIGIFYVGWGIVSSILKWSYHKVPFVATMDRMQSELEDKNTGLVAIANAFQKSQRQIDRIDSFLVGKYPEFTNLILSDAKDAALNGNDAQAIDLLRIVRAAWDKDRASDAAPSSESISTALESHNAIDQTTKNLALIRNAFEARVSLAVYSSHFRKVELPANLLGKPVINISKTVQIPCPTDTPFAGNQIDWIGPQNSGDFFAIAFPTSPSDISQVIENVSFSGGSQTLDGFTWRNVTFINCDIKWNGGVSLLESVRFVNCKFSISTPPASKSGKELLDYAALGKDILRLG